jgi:hypothetical protein
MAFSKDWSEWWRRSLGSPPGGDRKALADHPDITAVLQRIYEEEKKYRGEIRDMLMRSDSFALSLA